jgi:geranylgeranyl diphosphate synthase type I
MAINAGDALLVLAHESLLDLAEYYQPGVVLSAARLLDEGCRALSVGQFLDMSYQDKRDIGIQDYWPMVAGKTAALLATCCQLGALLGGSDDSRQDLYRSFGHYLGLAFQVQDDLLGIWGDDSLTGKSVVGDLVEGKKSLPVIVGLEKDGAFAERWRLGHISPAEAPGLAQLLARDGALEYTQDSARQMTDLALDSLRRAAPTGQAAELLGMMARGLLNRKA